MIVLRRANERRHERSGKQETWLTFDAQGGRPFSTGFGDLETLTERWLPPQATVRHPRLGAEIVTYVHEGALAYKDSTGQSGVVHAGEFQRLTAGCGHRRDENNPSRVEWARVFQVGLRPTEAGLAFGLEQKRFSVAERRGALRLVGSHDRDKGSLHLHQDTQIYSAILEPGQHAVHELVGARSAWLHVIRGEVQLSDTVLATGDGAGIATERSVSFTARLDAEVLLVDLRQASSRPS